MQQGPRIFVVDTNAYLRLFFSPIRPLLGHEIGGVKLMVIRELADEFFNSRRLKAQYAWFSAELQQELASAVLALPPDVAASIETDTSWYLDECNAVLQTKCIAEGRDMIRTLSLCDAKALTTALETNAGLITDEWPLRHVAGTVDPDDSGEKLEVWTTLDALAHLERAGALSKEDRTKTVAEWVKFGELLPQDWMQAYKKLFEEDPPLAN